MKKIHQHTAFSQAATIKVFIKKVVQKKVWQVGGKKFCLSWKNKFGKAVFFIFTSSVVVDIMLLFFQKKMRSSRGSDWKVDEQQNVMEKLKGKIVILK